MSLIANVSEEVSLGRWFSYAKIGGVAAGIRLLVLQLQEHNRLRASSAGILKFIAVFVPKPWA